MRKQVVVNATNIRRKSRQSQRRTPTNRVVLEKVLGITITNNSGLTCDPSSGLIAYPAGCVIVLLHPKKNEQSHIINTSRKTFTALAFSQDGKYLVTGESGHLPCVRVWDVSERSQVAEVQSHKYGVACVAFSANSSYIVSVGYQHDMTVSVWEWRKGTVIASNKVSSKVLAVSFSEDNSYFVTAGNRHIKFWYLNASKETRVNSTVPLIGRSGLLGEHKNSLFCSLACGRGSRANSTYCIVASGLLCLFNSKRELEAWMDLKTTSARCLSVSESYVFCGCANGTVRVFSPQNLQYITTLHQPHCLGVDITQGVQSGHLFTAKPEAQYPDTLALTFDPASRQLTCVYNDHSVYVWDVRDFRNVGKLYSAMYHSSCVWSVETYPEQVEASQACLPAGSFLTCSSDNTIRLWHGDPLLGPGQSQPRGPAPLPNIYSNDLLRVVYVGQDTQHLQVEAEKGDASGMDGKAGIRVMVVSPDGQHLAAGDRSGNLHIFGLQFMDEMEKIVAHDSEVLCLEFSPRETGLHLLASASRDRLIHIFNMKRNYSLEQTVYDHSASITAIKFTGVSPEVHMVSCGADKSIYFRTAEQTSEGLNFSRSHHVVEKTTLYDMDLDGMRTHTVIACQDRNIRVYNVESGKMKRCFKGSTSEEGTLLKVQMDPSGIYLATSCSDKNICIFDYESGECMATLFGHSEIVTCMRFSQDCRYLITVSGDSCVFVWKLDSLMTNTMRKKLTERRLRAGLQTTDRQPDMRRETFIVPFSQLTQSVVVEEEEEEETFLGEEQEEQTFLGEEQEEQTVLGEEDSKTPARFDLTFDFPDPDPIVLESNGKLPMWFRKLNAAASTTSTASTKPAAEPQQHPPQPPRSRWVDQANTLVLPMYSVLTPSPMRPEGDQEEEDDPHFHPQSLDSLLGEEEEEEEQEQDEKTQLLAEDEQLFADTRPSPPDRSHYILCPANSTARSTGGEGEEELSPDSACCMAPAETQDQTQDDTDSLSQVSSTGSSVLEEEEEEEEETLLRQHFETMANSLASDEKFGMDLRSLQPAPEERPFLNPRLSISTRFLSRFQSRLRLGLGQALPPPALPPSISEESSNTSSSLDDTEMKAKSCPDSFTTASSQEEQNNVVVVRRNSAAARRRASTTHNHRRSSPLTRPHHRRKTFSVLPWRRSLGDITGEAVVLQSSSQNIPPQFHTNGPANQQGPLTSLNKEASSRPARQRYMGTTASSRAKKAPTGLNIEEQPSGKLSSTTQDLSPDLECKENLPPVTESLSSSVEPYPRDALPPSWSSVEPSPRDALPPSWSSVEPSPHDPLPPSWSSVEPSPRDPLPPSWSSVEPSPHDPLPPSWSSVEPSPRDPLPPSWSSVEHSPHDPLPPSWSSVEPSPRDALPPSWSSSVEPSPHDALPPSWSSSVEPGLHDALPLSPGNHGARAALHLDLFFSERPAPLGSSMSPLSSNKACSPCRPAMVTPTQIRPLDSPRRPAMVTPTEMRSLGKEGKRRISSIEESLISRGRTTSLAHALAMLTESPPGGHSAGGPVRREAGGHQVADMLSSQPSGLCASPLSGASASLSEGSGEQSHSSSTGSGEEQVNLQMCHQVISDFKHSMRTAVDLYQKVGAMTGGREQSLLMSILKDGFSAVQTDMDSVLPAGGEPAGGQLSGDGTLALLERYSDMLLQITQRKMDCKGSGL